MENEDEKHEGSFFITIPVTVLNEEMNPSAKILFGYISSLIAADGYCHASNGYLAKMVKTDTRQIQRFLEELEHHGFLVKDIPDDGKPRKLGIDMKLPYQRGDDKNVVGGVKNVVGGRQNCRGSLKKENLASSLASPLSSSLNNPISNPTPNSYSLEKKEQQVIGSSYGDTLDKGCGEKNTETTEERTQALFEQFWKAYPRKDSKKAALKAFTRIPNLDEEFPRIMEAVEAAKKSNQWNEDHGKYIPYPATYLNGEKWKDEGTQTQEDKMNEALRGLNSLFGIKEVF